MSLISRAEISNYLTEGLETNHFANWNPMLTGITLRMDSKSALVNITNGGGKTSMAELLLYLLSRDKTLLSHLRDKTAPKGRGYTHARIEFRDTDTSSFREPSLLEIDIDNLPGSTRVIGVAINNDVADAPIFYSYSGTLEDSPCYTVTDSVLQNVPDDIFVKRTRAIPGSQWNTFRNVTEWQEHVGLSISMDVVRRNATYQAKGSDDKNASFFNFKPRNGESYDSAFFKAVIAPDLLTNLLNSFSEEGESSIGDTLHISLSHIVNSERDIARKQENLEHRESAIGVDLKPVVEAGAKANNAHAAMQAALRAVRKDVALLHHFGSQDSPCTIPGLPRPVTSLVRHGDQDSRIRKAIKGMVISRDDGILILDKTLSELAGVEVRVITQSAERMKISHSALNSQVIDFNCDFDNHTSATPKGGHYRKGYPRQSIEALLPLFAETSGATLEGLEDVFKAAFDIAESQIDTNPASLKILGLEARLATNGKKLSGLQKQSQDLANAIEGIENQIKGREENEAAWKEFSAISSHLPEHLRSEPKQAKDWLANEVGNLQQQLADMNKRQGALTEGWTHYLAALEESGLEGLDGIRKQYVDLVDVEKKIKNDGRRARTNLDFLNGKTLKFERDVLNAENALRLCESALKNMEELKSSFALFQSYFGDVDPLGVDDPYKTAQELERKKHNADHAFQSSKSEWNGLTSLRAGASRFSEIFGPDIDPLTFDPHHEHRKWAANESLAQQGLLPLEPLVTALESFTVKFPGQSPAKWIEKTDIHRSELETRRLEIERSLEKTGLEIEALDRLAIVDDASFSRAWTLLGDGPQRLYALLQGMDGTADRRVGALSALTGLLSAPVFDSLEALHTAAELLERHDIGIPLLLKAPLLKAIETQGDLGGELRVMSFFAGRYSRQAKILLDPDFAQKERALLVSRVSDLTLALAVLGREIEEVDFRSQDYVLATKALEAIKSNSAAKYQRYEMDLAEAQTALHKLKPQIQTNAIECLTARKRFLQKGGDEKLAALWDDYQAMEVQFNLLVVEWEAAQKKATPEISQSCWDAKKYVMQGADVAYGKAKLELENASERVASLSLVLKNHNEEVEIAQGILDIASEREQKFNEEDSPSRILKLKQVLDFSEHVDNVDFMQRFNTRYAEVDTKVGRFVSFQASVNFERATAYYENLGKSEVDLVNAANTKKSELAKIITEKREASDESRVIRDAEIPAWTVLRKAIHEFAYEIGSQAAITKVAHSEFCDLEEGEYPVEAHYLYTDLATLRLKIISPTIDETATLASLISEQTFKIHGLNPKDSLATFLSRKKIYELAANEYSQKNKAFCEKSRMEAGSKLAAFNALELGEIEQSTPEQIRSLLTLFERLNLSLNKDRDDAKKAIQAAQNANEEALTQLSSLIRVAEDNLDAMKKVMGRYPNGCFKIKVQIAGEDLIKEILSELKIKIKGLAADASESGRTLRRSEESKIKDLLRETLIDKVFLEPKVTFIHGGIRAKESPVTEKLSTGQKVALEFMWIVRQAEYEIERGLKQLSSKQAEKKRQMTNRVIFVDGIFSTLSDRQIIREAFSGLNELGGNFQIIGFLHSPTWTNDSSVFPVYHVGKKLMNASGSSLVAFNQEGRKTGTLGFLTTISQRHESTV